MERLNQKQGLLKKLEQSWRQLSNTQDIDVNFQIRIGYGKSNNIQSWNRNFDPFNYGDNMLYQIGEAVWELLSVQCEFAREKLQGTEEVSQTRFSGQKRKAEQMEPDSTV